MQKSPEPIFLSDDVEVRHFHGSSDVCFVTFTSLGLRHEEGFGQRLFVSRDVSSIYFISKWNHWYQPQSIRDAAEKVAKVLRQRGYGSVVTYGASMGGFGAAAFAGMLGATRAVLLAPQFTIQPAKPPFERRWAREAAKITFSFDDLPAQMGGAAKTVVYDPLSNDRGHARLFAATPNCDLIHAPFCGHTPGRVLLHCGLLQALPTQVADGSFDRQAFHAKLHRGRRGHVEYWAALADYAQKHSAGRDGPRRSRFAFALHAARQGLLLSPDQNTLVLQTAYLLLHLDRVSEAQDAARRAVALAPEHPAPWRALSVALRRSAEFPEALDAARRAVSLRENDVDLRRLLIQGLLSMRLFEEAVREGRAAIGLDPSYAEAYAFVGAALRQLGRVNEAIDLFQSALDRRPGVEAWARQLTELRSLATPA